MEEEPCCKKPKLEPTIENEVITNYIDQIRFSSKNLKAVLSDELTQAIETTQMYAGSIKHRKDISKAIKVLNEKIPLNGLGHLKRVCNDSVLICPLEALHEVCIEDYVKFNVQELEEVFGSFKEVPVPKHQAKLKRQHAEVNKIWSCNFHPDAYLERLVGDNFFMTKELETHHSYMTLAFKVALWHFELAHIEKVTESIFESLNVSVVVDPSINSVVAIGVDNSSTHPVQHSTMLAIDNVAKTQNGGAWNCINIELDRDCTLNGIDKKLLSYLCENCPQIKFGAKKYLSKQDLLNEEKSTSDGPYLCTNYYVYTLREPCLMCAMALVHARVKRVFYCFDKPESGALKSKTKLHTVSLLNHHYEVFTGFL